MPQARKNNRTKVRNVVKAVCETVWNIEPYVLESIVELLQLREEGREFTEQEIQERINVRNQTRVLDEEFGESGPVIFDNVAVIPIQGVMSPRMNMFMRISGGTSTQLVGIWLKQLKADESVTHIVFNVDSPGGSAKGNQELVDIINDVKQTKRVIAVVEGMAASAGYYVASAAHEIVMTASSDAGSLGTLLIHREMSKALEDKGIKYTILRACENKALLNEIEPLTEKSLKQGMEIVNDHYDMFVGAVANNRGVTREHVLENFGQGKMFIASKAIAAGMADRLGTLESVVAEFRKPSTSSIGTSGSSRLGNLNLRSGVVNKELLAFLKTLGVIEDSTSEDQQVFALRAVCLSNGVSLNEDWEDQQTDILQKLTAAMTTRLPALAGVGGSQTETQTGQDENNALTPAQIKEHNRIRQLERARIDDLTARAALLGISEDDLQSAIDEQTPVDQALMNWTKIMAENNQPLSTQHQEQERFEYGASGLEKFGAAAQEALLRRIGDYEFDKPPSNSVKALEYKSLLSIAEESLRMQGIRCDQMIPDEIASTALGQMDGSFYIRDGETSYNRPGTFPHLMAALVGKEIVRAFEFSPATYKQWTHQLKDVPDFKPKTIHAVGEFGEFPMVPDGEDFEESTTKEEVSWIQADKYGDEWKLTPAMIVGDDLDVLTDVATDKTVAHENTLNRLCINLLTGNVNTSDQIPLFDAQHLNDRTSGGEPSSPELAAQRLLLRKQSGIAGKRRLSLPLRKILIPEDHETVAEQLLDPLMVVPTEESKAQNFRGKVQYIVDTMLGDVSPNVWFGMTDPRVARFIVYCHQRGYARIRIKVYFNPKNGCMVFQFEGRFAAAVRSFRGVTRNSGVA